MKITPYTIIKMEYMIDDTAFNYTSSEAGSEYDEYFAEDAEEEIVQVLDELQITINDQTIRHHEVQESDRITVLKKTHQKHNFAYSVKQKILITQETESVGNVKATARKYKILPKQILNWRSQLFELRQKARSNPNAKTAGAGRVVEYLELEKKLHKWIEELRLEDIPVRTNNIIAQAINLDKTG
jgi:protein-tyrosine-phosphatase